MTFSTHMTRCPSAFEPDRGEEGAAPFANQPPEIRDLLRGTAGCSPYLKDSMIREAAWLNTALTQDPDTGFASVLADINALERGEMGRGLRVAKRRAALLIALADLGGMWSLGQVTGALTALADLSVQRALETALHDQLRRGKLPGLTEDDLKTGGGLCVLAMGKMGAGELNYSSDIDLICLIDETRFEDSGYADARTGFIRATRAMAAFLSEVTADGYVFRTDLRLRPDPGSTPVCLAMGTAERYYESLGRTWERAAHVKARPCAGDIAAGEAYLDRLRPFVWRRHLDFAAIQDAHDMRLRIREHKGLGGEITLEGHDMKLGRGGIREIEFFTQTRQIIAGGRDPSLRTRGTLEGLTALVKADWVKPDVAATLTDDYIAHRTVEHRLQMIRDAQTHELPTTERGFDRLAAMMDRDVADLRAELNERLSRVAETCEGFFAPDPTEAPQDGDTSPEPTADQAEIFERWPNYPALRSERAQQIFERLRPAFLSRLATSAQPERALLHLDGFMKGLPAGVQLFSLFEANPHLIDLVMDIADTAPDLAHYLSRNAGVLDAVLAGRFFAPWPGAQELTEDLERHLAEDADYEAELDQLRVWSKEWRFRIGTHLLRGLIDAETAGAQYADVAGAVLTGVWPRVVREFSDKHGAPPGAGAMVLGMGSLGARRLNAGSDLDLIVIYDSEGQEASDGRRPLAARPYFARLTQALVTALSVPMSEGRVYEVDMRLRPSGKQGPVATAYNAFDNYQRTEAWTWEHLALTRARPVAGSDALCSKVEGLRHALITLPRETASVLGDVDSMRDRLAAAHRPKGAVDARNGSGRLQDIELFASTLALLAGSDLRDVVGQIRAGQAAGLIEAEAADVLIQTQGELWAIHAAARLLSPEALDLSRLGKGGVNLLLRETKCDSAESLPDYMSRLAEASARIIDAGLRSTDKGGSA